MIKHAALDKFFTKLNNDLFIRFDYTDGKDYDFSVNSDNIEILVGRYTLLNFTEYFKKGSKIANWGVISLTKEKNGLTIIISDDEENVENVEIIITEDPDRWSRIDVNGKTYILEKGFEYLYVDTKIKASKAKLKFDEDAYEFVGNYKVLDKGFANFGDSNTRRNVEQRLTKNYHSVEQFIRATNEFHLEGHNIVKRKLTESEDADLAIDGTIELDTVVLDNSGSKIAYLNGDIIEIQNYNRFAKKMDIIKLDPQELKLVNSLL